MFVSGSVIHTIFGGVCLKKKALSSKLMFLFLLGEMA